MYVCRLSSAVRTGQSGYEKRCMFEDMGYEKRCMFESMGYEKHCMFVLRSRLLNGYVQV